MTVRTITAKAGTDDGSPTATVSFDFGDNLAEASDLFGDDVVYGRFVSAATVDVQALIRRHLSSTDKDGNSTAKTEEEIQKIVAEYKPGTSTRKHLSATEKADRAIAKLTPEEKTALLESLMESD